jgi:TetR/AcrR family transcriptional repressor of bet genes
MGRPSNTDARRAQIVGAMVAVMGERGYQGASVAEIARRAGLAPGLVHYHFRDKRAVLLALIDELGERATRRAGAGLGASSGSERLDAVLDAFLGLGASADPAEVACWAAAAVEATGDEIVRAAYARVVRGLIDLFEDLVRGVDPGATRGEAAALVAGLQGYFLLASAAPGEIPRGTAAAAMKRMATGLVRREPPRPGA